MCLSKGTFACCTAFPFACCCTTFRLALLFPLHAAPFFPLHAAPLQSICMILMLSCSTNFVMLSCCTLHSFTPALCCHQTVCVHVGCLAVQLPSPSCALQACFHACMGPCKWTHDMSLKHVDSDLLCFAELFRLAVLCRHIEACCAVLCFAVLCCADLMRPAVLCCAYLFRPAVLGRLIQTCCAVLCRLIQACAVLCRLVYGQWRSDCSGRGSGHPAAAGLPAGFWLLHLAVPVPPQIASAPGGLHPA